MNSLNLAFFSIILAQDDIVFSFRPLGAALRERLIVIGAIAVVVGVAALFIIFSRTKRRTSHRHHRHHPKPAAGKTEARRTTGEHEHEHGHGRRRRRIRRREHRPRNPTLAETGGLPPLRRDDEPPAPPLTQTQPQ